MGLDASLRFSVRVSILRPGISDRLTWPVFFFGLETLFPDKALAFRTCASRAGECVSQLFFQEEPRGASNGRCYPCDRVPGTASGQVPRRDENLRNRRYQSAGAAWRRSRSAPRRVAHAGRTVRMRENHLDLRSEEHTSELQ